MGHRIGHNVVADLLRDLNDSPQANHETREGTHDPDRDAQFGHITKNVAEAPATGEPAISVDTKKKELVGDFKNAGRELRPKGQPEPVRVHDFKIPELGRASPHGVYDIAGNTGWVSVGIDHDTASFAVNAIRRWWWAMGQARHPRARGLPITAVAVAATARACVRGSMNSTRWRSISPRTRSMANGIIRSRPSPGNERLVDQRALTRLRLDVEGRRGQRGARAVRPGPGCCLGVEPGSTAVRLSPPARAMRPACVSIGHALAGRLRDAGTIAKIRPIQMVFDLQDAFHHDV
jgi:hypothetical protein